MITPLMQIKMNDKPKRKYNAELFDATRLTAKVGRKKLPVEEKVLRQRQSWHKKYGDKIVFQARTQPEGKAKIEVMKKQLGFTNNDQLLEWFIERGERSLARKHGGFDFDKLD